MIADGKYGNFLMEFDFDAFEPLALRAETIIDLISHLFYPRLLQYPVYSLVVVCLAGVFYFEQHHKMKIAQDGPFDDFLLFM